MPTTLTTGQRLPLSTLQLPTTFELSLSVSGQADDYDAACFVLGAGSRLLGDEWMVFYNQPRSPDGAVMVRRIGPSTVFVLNLEQLGPQVERLAFTVSPDSQTPSGGDMAGVGSGELRVGDAIWTFNGRDFGSEKAIIAAEIYRHQGTWRLMINGQGFANGLSGLVSHFGGSLAQPSSAAAPNPATTVPKPAIAVPAPAPAPLQPQPAPAPTISLTKVTLEKQGQTARINLNKSGNQPFHVNLNWDAHGKATKPSGFLGRLLAPASSSGADLDLGCMYELQDGDKGVIQAIGGRMGLRGQPPYIYLDQDDRSGASSNGENLYLERPDLIKRVLIFAFIYEGVGNFGDVGGRLSFTDPQGNDVRMQLSNPAALPFCAVALLETRGHELSITKEERYFADHEKCDHAYGFGFSWKAGRKD